MSAEPEAQTEAIDPVGHIVRTPGVMSGRPRIARTRIRVSDIASHHFHHGLTVPEIADQLVVSEADVYAALAYYCDHRAEIEANERDDAELIERLKADFPESVVDHRE